MFITDKFAMVHIPKTAGMWVIGVLGNFFEHKKTFHTKEKVDVPTFTCVRNPWDWHVSHYEFSLKIHNSVEGYYNQTETFNLMDFTHPNDIEFDDYLNFYNRLDPQEKNDLWYTHKYRRQYDTKHHVLGTLVNDWLINNKSFYETQIDYYTNDCDYIARFENVVEDVKTFLSMHNLLTDEISHALDTTPPIWVTNENGKTDYREYYNDETKLIVQNGNKNMIEKFGYTFEGVK